MPFSGSCRRCNTALYGKPKLLVLGSTHCFRCAKIDVGEEQSRRYGRAHDKHRLAMSAFNQRKLAAQALRAKRWERRQIYIEHDRLGFWPKLGTIIAAAIVVDVLDPGHGWGFLAFLMLAVASYLVTEKEDARRAEEFDRSNPPPPELSENEPAFEYEGQVIYELLPPDDSAAIPKNRLRDEIIRRDKLTCQSCGTRKQKKNLEVHHIIPSSAGGIDHPTNLVSLCLHCHDREDWFGHKRKYPTTILYPRSRTRWYR